MTEIGVIILTKNEELHIRRCLDSLSSAYKVFVVDSGSTDNTVAILENSNVRWVHRRWVSYSDQMNWAIKNFPYNVDWFLRLDADEYLTDTSALNKATKSADESISGLLVRRNLFFEGYCLKYGGINPMWHLRIWRKGYARCESRWMDEHMVLEEGDYDRCYLSINDDNKNGLDWWLTKHVGYALRESMDLVISHYANNKKENLKSDAKARRKLKTIYGKLPPFFRSILYFIYRYLILGGFRDGKIGLKFHILQGLWYRIVVDFFVVDILKHSNNLAEAADYVEKKYGKNLLFYHK